MLLMQVIMMFMLLVYAAYAGWLWLFFWQALLAI
jgi:hypothetical protein